MTRAPQFVMLILHLQIDDPFFSAAFEEILPQTGVFLTKNENECDGILSSSTSSAPDLPVLNIVSLPKSIRLIDFMSLLENLPYSRSLTFSHFSLDLREKILKNLKTQETHRLTGKECQCLRFLHQHKGQEISKERLLKEIWGYHPDTTTHTLETHIYRLRQKLEENPAIPQLLRNCTVGYVLSEAA